jgi:hypothetical protein
VYDASTVAVVTLFEPMRQSFESYPHMIVCRPSAWAIARIRSYARIKGVGITVFQRETRNQEAYINVSIGRAPAGRGDTCDELDSLHLGREKGYRDRLRGDRPALTEYHNSAKASWLENAVTTKRYQQQRT